MTRVTRLQGDQQYQHVQQEDPQGEERVLEPGVQLGSSITMYTDGVRHLP